MEDMNTRQQFSFSFSEQYSVRNGTRVIKFETVQILFLLSDVFAVVAVYFDNLSLMYILPSNFLEHVWRAAQCGWAIFCVYVL